MTLTKVWTSEMQETKSPASLKSTPHFPGCGGVVRNFRNALLWRIVCFIQSLFLVYYKHGLGRVYITKYLRVQQTIMVLLLLPQEENERPKAGKERIPA